MGWGGVEEGSGDGNVGVHLGGCRAGSMWGVGESGVWGGVWRELKYGYIKNIDQLINQIIANKQ